VRYAKSSMSFSRLLVRVTWGAARSRLERSGRLAIVALLRLVHSAVAAAERTD
jgi:hypothetical protein